MIVRPILCKSFVGRREELAYLRERRLEAGASHGGLVLVAGEAGVGKSRLIAEFCGSLAYAKWRIGQGACLEFASRPYGPLLDVLARVDTRPFELAAVASKAEQFDAIVARIVGIAAKSALVIAIEDVHWADAATLDLLAYLGPKLGRMRVLVVATYRTHDLPLDHPAVAAIEKISRDARAGRIELSPLRGTELRTFIDDALAGIALPDETRRAIALAGDGNPFFTEELLKSAVESGASHERPRGGNDLPPTVRATLLERLAPFDTDERRIVSQAAVIGRTFELSLLAQTLATESERLLPALRRARDFQLIEEVSSTVFRFRHGLTRDAIYSDFLGAEVRPRHRAIAVALEDAPSGDRALEALAYHWWAAGDGARSARYNEAAGDAAAAVAAHDDALAFFERALEATGLTSLTIGTLWEKVAECQIALAETIAANGALERAAGAFAMAGAYDREASARLVAAQVAYVLDFLDPTAGLEAMLARLDPSHHLATSRAAVGVAWILASFWFPARATTYLERVDARALADNVDLRARYHNVSAWVAMTIGDLDTFRREHALWLAAAREVGTPRAIAGAHYNGALCLGFFGAHDEALALLDRSLTITRAARLQQAESSTHEIAAMVHLFRGDLAAARAAATAVPITAENQNTVKLAFAWGSLVAIALDDRELIAAFFDGREAEQLASPDFDSAAAIAELFVRRGRPRDAMTLLDRATTDGDVIRASFYTFLAMGKYGSPATRIRARGFLARAAIGPSPSPETYALDLFDARLARASGQTDVAIASARRAADGFRALRFPLLEAEALEEAGDREDALAIYRRCGARYAVTRLSGDRAQTNGAPNTGADSDAAAILSARELEIARLAAAGRSNVQIARDLSITHKTVEKHLGSAYQKLGVASRLDLRAHV